MVEEDLDYFHGCFQAGLIREPFLEIGSAIVADSLDHNLCDVVRNLGLREVYGSDLREASGVDFTADFGVPVEEFSRIWAHGRFETVAIFNVLEHTFDPITVLRNALFCVRPGGTLCVVTPAVWALHDYPRDYVRLQPHWFEEFGQRNHLEICRERFSFISFMGIVPIDQLKRGNQYQLPTYINSTRRATPIRFWVSRILHRVFNTYGRTQYYTHIGLGCVYRRKG
jgi:SAM-dependent methyltransferase